MVENEQEAEDRSLAGAITRALSEEIVTGVLPSGAWLRQDHVAQRFGASHVPVREAFRRLEARRLVESVPRRGVRIPPLEPADVLELTAMRVALECLALRQAAARLTPRDIQAAETALADGEAATSPLLLEEANRRFHQSLYRACAMPRLLHTIADLQQASARYLFAAWRDLAWQTRSQAEHRAILDALDARRPAEAEGLLSAHIRAAGEGLAHALARRDGVTV